MGAVVSLGSRVSRIHRKLEEVAPSDEKMIHQTEKRILKTTFSTSFVQLIIIDSITLHT